MKTRTMLYMFAMILIVSIFSIESFAQINWIAATDSSGKTFHVSFNEKTGTANRIIGLPVNFSRYGNISRQNVEDLSREFLDEYSGLTKVRSSDLILKRADNNKGKWYINFQQLYSGVPVYRAFIGFTVGETGKVLVLGSDAYPDISIDAAPSVSSTEAMRITQSNFMKLSGTDSPTIRKEPELLILPFENEKGFDYFLAWNIELEYRGPGESFSQAYFLNAKDGDIIKQYSNRRGVNKSDGNKHASIYGTVKLIYFPEDYLDPDVVDTCYYERAKIKLYDSLPQLVGTEYTDQSGYYIFDGLAVTTHFIKAKLGDGIYAEIRDYDDNHEYQIVSGQHDWIWSANEGTTVYYHLNRIHDYITDSPFNFDTMDYPLEAKITSSTSVSAQCWGCWIEFGKKDNKPWAMTRDAINHEYAHSIIWWLYGESFIEPDPDEEYTKAAAMDEGFADYFSCTLSGDPYCAESIFPYGGYELRDLDNDRTYYELYGSHWNGQVIGGACWDLLQDIGKSTTD